MTIKKRASAHWQGGIKDGKGRISTESGALKDRPYGFNTRFEDQPGTNPEELIGAAHAGCFSMALSKELEERGMLAESIDTQAEVWLEKEDGGFRISAVHLSLRARIPGARKSTRSPGPRPIQASASTSATSAASASTSSAR